MEPSRGHGKVCYLEIPTTDVERSAAFYRTVFGWQTRTRGDGAVAFDDAAGQVSGAWVRGRPPIREAGTLVYIMVDNIDEAVAAVVKNGGQVVQPVGVDAPELTARFVDPAGNLFGLYEEPRKK